MTFIEKNFTYYDGIVKQRCYKCRVHKELKFFHVDHSKKHKVNSICKECLSEQRKKIRTVEREKRERKKIKINNAKNYKKAVRNFLY